MAFAKDIKRGQPIADLPVAKRTAEQALADTSTPIPPPTTIAPTVVLPASQRDEIRQRVSSFKTHQEKIAREREEYYLQVKASMLAPVDPSGFRSEINPREPRGINHNMEKSGHAIPKREEIKGTAPRGGLWNDRLNRES